jgi:23S rRNA (guanosine2251-2'-O)-methyltransferase
MNIICGINPVVEALASGTRHFDRLLVAKGLRNRRVSEAMRLASQKGVALRFETRETLDRIAGDVPHQGLVAVVSAKPVMSLEALLEQAKTPAMLVVLDGIEDPRNLGAILRTVEAAGADGVLLPERHTAGLSETVARASAGGIEHVRVARIGNVAQALETLKERGLWIVGFDAAGTERWDAIDYRRPVALVFGGEDRGIRRLVREKCDHLASVPLFGHVGSLNVSVTAGVALYEAVRQRGTVPSQVRPIPPGATPSDAAAADGAHSWSDDEADYGDEKGALVLIEEHDALAWTPPVVLNHVGQRSRKNRGRNDERRLHQRPKPRARQPETGDAQANAGADEGERPRGDAPGRRRRRKGRRPAEGREPRPASAAGETGNPPPARAGGDRGGEGAARPGPAEGPQETGNAENGPRRGRNGHRRRRRRRRPPAAPTGGS